MAYNSVDGRYGRITVFTNDTGAATKSLLTYGEWAENEISFLRQFVAQGCTILDIGAYIGTHTLAFADVVSPMGLVIAVEAQPDTFELLKKNVETRLVTGSIRLENAVATSETGQISIPTIDIRNEGSFGSASLQQTLIQPGSNPTDDANTLSRASVRAITIDSLRLSDCALIKVDVEGTEDMVLLGALETLERCAPVVYAECNSLSGGLRSMAVLQRAGYTSFAHVVNAFNPDNFLRVEENIFGEAREVALVAVPMHRAEIIQSLSPRSFELILDVESADDLALALLNKPQYQLEVLRRSRAAKTGGSEFLDRSASLRLSFDRILSENAALQQLRIEERKELQEQFGKVREQLTGELAHLHTLLTSRDDDIRRIQAEIEDKNREIAELHSLLIERHSDNTSLHAQVTERDSAVGDLQAAIAKKNTETAQLHILLTQRDTAITCLQAEIVQRNSDLDNLRTQSAEKDAAISRLQGLIRQRDIEICNLDYVLTRQGENIAGLQKDFENRDRDFDRVREALSSVYHSYSWQVTRPLRWASKVVRRSKSHDVADVTNAITSEHLKALDVLWREKEFERALSYTANIALTLQPQSYSDFHRHPEFNEVFKRWTQGDKYRGLDFARLWGMVLNCKHALSHGEGSIAELGVYQGQSAAVLSLYAEQFSRKLYLCDTFSGFPEQQFEEEMSEGKKVAFKDISLESAQSTVGSYPDIRWVVGMFPDSITEEMRNDRFAFVSIDCDIYEPIYQGLHFFWPRLASGGVIFVHDYSSGYWPGATKAVDEFCGKVGVAGCLLPDLAGTYILTKGKA